VKPLSDPLTLNGKVEETNKGCEVLSQSHQAFVDASRVEKQQGREALKRGV